ncbi:MAG: CRTAC1 family protein [Myxococcota bacterium]
MTTASGDDASTPSANTSAATPNADGSSGQATGNATGSPGSTDHGNADAATDTTAGIDSADSIGTDSSSGDGMPPPEDSGESGPQTESSGTTDLPGGTTDASGSDTVSATTLPGGSSDGGGGTTDFSGGSTFGGGGTTDFSGGTTDFSGGTTDFSGGTTDFSGGTTDFSGGTTDFSGGTTGGDTFFTDTDFSSDTVFTSESGGTGGTDTDGVGTTDPGGTSGVGSGGDPLLDVGTPLFDLGAPPPDIPLPMFTDVTIEAGLDLDAGDLLPPPFCSLDDVTEPWEMGNYCTPDYIVGAVAVADYDNDGWPDVYMTRMNGPDWLLHNQGDGTFVDVAASAGLTDSYSTGGVAWVDIEGDGDLDLMVSVVAEMRYYLYVNDGTGHFTDEALIRGADITTLRPHVGMSVAVGDYDLDGYMDLLLGEWHSNIELGPGEDHFRLLHNLGAASPGFFEDVTLAVGLDMQAVSASVGAPEGAWPFSPAFVDLDGDRYPELAVAADYGTSRLWWNDGAGGFVDMTDVAGVGTDEAGMGSTFGDYDNDGDLDWFVSSIWWPGQFFFGNRMYRNEGGLNFYDATDDVGVRFGDWGWGTSLFDADLDGSLDLILGSGYPSFGFSDNPLRLWHNDGPGPWTEMAVAAGIDFTREGRGLVTFDYDRDGDLDVLVHSHHEIQGFYRNDAEVASWLGIRAGGQGGNSQGVGAVVRVQTEPGAPIMMRHIGVASHYLAQAENIAHFGLGYGLAPVHSVEVYWPATDHTVVLNNVPRDQLLTIDP